MIARSTLRSSALRLISRAHSEGTTQSSGSVSSTAPPPSSVDAPGLSRAVLQTATEPVGPGVKPDKSGPYKSPEYYCYNQLSFYEAEVEMSKYRCPQPSALKK